MASPTPKLEKVKNHPGIYRRGGRFVVTYRDPDGRRRKRFCATLGEAKTLKAALRTDIERGEYRDTHRALFADYAREWIARYAGRTGKGVLEETRLDYAARLEQDAIPLLGRVRLCDIGPKHLDRLAERVASGPLCRECHGRGFVESGQVCRVCERRGRLPGKASSPSTVRLALAPVKALLADAAQRGDLRGNPVAGYRTRYAMPAREGEDDADAKPEKALSEEQLAQLLEAIEAVDPTWRPFFTFLAQSGLRIGEAIELRWGDIDLGKKTVRVSRAFYSGRAGERVGAPKSKYGRRTIRLSAGMAQHLWRRQAEERPDDDDLVWTAKKGGRISATNLMRRVLKPAARKVDLEWAGFHTFRHTCGTMLFRHGLNAKQVQAWLGHHSPAFTLAVYVHSLEEDLPDETGFLDAAVGDTWAPSPAETGRQPDGENDGTTPIRVVLPRAVSG